MRSLLIALGHDEEVGGGDGAHEIGKLLESRGVQPLFLLDEGSVVLSSVFPGVQNPVIEISVAEKGKFYQKYECLWNISLNIRNNINKMNKR